MFRAWWTRATDISGTAPRLLGAHRSWRRHNMEHTNLTQRSGGLGPQGHGRSPIAFVPAKCHIICLKKGTNGATSWWDVSSQFGSPADFDGPFQAEDTKDTDSSAKGAPRRKSFPFWTAFMPQRAVSTLTGSPNCSACQKQSSRERWVSDPTHCKDQPELLPQRRKHGS